jgi:exodeoxyribonuclease V alpha subunit
MSMTWQELLASKDIKMPQKPAPKTPQITIPHTEKEETQKNKTFSLSIELDEDQQHAVELALAGKSFCIIGKAGTGKTTTEREIVKAILKNNVDCTHVFRIQGTSERVESAAAAVVAYTRIASGNSRKAICKDPDLAERFFPNVTTIHNMLEFQPEFFFDTEKNKESMRFAPKRNSANPLTLKTVCFEEASMIDLNLWEKMYDAMLRGTQCIFIGDINQLPPVFGPSILNYALVQLPIVELRTVYRQAFDSLVLKNAHNILEGKKVEEGPDFKIMEGGTKQHGQMITMLQLAGSLQKWHKGGEYKPEEDIVLSPFNKGELGSDSINNHIAQFLNENDTYEIIAGIRKFYLAAGDRIMFQKQIGYVKTIRRNGAYSGRLPMPHSKHLTRFGTMNGEDDLVEIENDGLAHIEYDLEQMSQKDMEELTHQASHVIDIELETGETLSLSKAGELSAQVFSLAYALTVHKAQGCEWRKVIIVLHKDHSVMAFNELLYTAVTRAAKQIVIVGKKFMVEKAIKTRRLKGDTLAEKVEYFNANMVLNHVSCVKN